VRKAELVLQGRLAEAKKEVRRCLCDDFDTPAAVVALQELVKAVNKVCYRQGRLLSFPRFSLQSVFLTLLELDFNFYTEFSIENRIEF